MTHGQRVHISLPGTVYWPQHQQAMTQPIEDGPSPHERQENDSAWSVPSQKYRASSLHPILPAAHHHSSAQPTRKHTSQGHPWPLPTCPEDPFCQELDHGTGPIHGGSVEPSQPSGFPPKRTGWSCGSNTTSPHSQSLPAR
jgi:hypothetical protein